MNAIPTHTPKTLRNGAIILQQTGDLILAYWPDRPHPFVVWREDAVTKGEVHSGTYSETITAALQIFQRKLEMAPFTVLLLYPDYIAHSFGQDTYLAHVEAASVEGAVFAAQAKAAANNAQFSAVGEDFYPLLVTYGHINDERT